MEKRMPEISIELVRPCIEAMVQAQRNGYVDGYVQYFARDIILVFPSKVLFGVYQARSFYLRDEEFERAKLAMIILGHHVGVTKVRSAMVPVLKLAIHWTLTYHSNTGRRSWVPRKRGDKVEGFVVHEWQIKRSTGHPEVVYIASC